MGNLMSFEQLETEMDVTEAKFIPIVMKEMKKIANSTTRIVENASLRNIDEALIQVKPNSERQVLQNEATKQRMDTTLIPR